MGEELVKKRWAKRGERRCQLGLGGDDVSWMLRVRVELGHTYSARTFWLSAEVSGRMTSSS